MVSGLKLSVVLTPCTLEHTKRSWPITADGNGQDYLCSGDFQTSIRLSPISQLERATSYFLISIHIIRREEEYLRSLWSLSWTRYFPPFMKIEFSQPCSQKFPTQHDPRGGAWQTRHLQPPFGAFVRNWRKGKVWVYQLTKTKITLKNWCISIWRRIILGRSVKLFVNCLGVRHLLVSKFSGCPCFS